MAEAVGCGAKCAKYILIIFNFIFWLSGAALLAVGIWILVDPNINKTLDIFGSLDKSAELMKFAAYVLIGIGGFVFIVGFCGCCGAIRLSKCLLIIYIICLFIIMAGEIAGGVLAYVKKDDVINGIKKAYTTAISDYSTPKNTSDELVNAIQQGFDCCGITEQKDWESSPLFTDKKQNVPWSCCKKLSTTKKLFWERSADDVEDCTSGGLSAWVAPDPKISYINNCEEGVKEWAESKITILIGVGVGIACLEIFGFIFAICLCRNIEEDD